MIIGIEGTGSQGWEQYDLCRTFVRRVLHQSTLSPKYYLIGPGNDGLDGWRIINAAWLKVMHGYEGPLVLVGYSRGAAYCMDVARTWGKNGGRCDVLVLFDAVARQADQDLPEKVPGNVTTCYHAYRDPRAGSRKFFSPRRAHRARVRPGQRRARVHRARQGDQRLLRPAGRGLRRARPP